MEDEDYKRHEHQFYMRVECHIWCLTDGSWVCGSLAGDWPYREVRASTMALALAEWVRQCYTDIGSDGDPNPPGFDEAVSTLGTGTNSASTFVVTSVNGATR